MRFVRVALEAPGVCLHQAVNCTQGCASALRSPSNVPQSFQLGPPLPTAAAGCLHPAVQLLVATVERRIPSSLRRTHGVTQLQHTTNTAVG